MINAEEARSYSHSTDEFKSFKAEVLEQIESDAKKGKFETFYSKSDIESKGIPEHIYKGVFAEISRFGFKVESDFKTVTVSWY